MGWSKCVKCGTEHNPFTACPALAPKPPAATLTALLNVTQQAANGVTQQSAQRQAKWRRAHPDQHRTYQRVYMATRRRQGPATGSQSRQDALGGANGAVTVAEGVG